MDILRVLFRILIVRYFIDFIMVDVTCVVSCHGIPPDAGEDQSVHSEESMTSEEDGDDHSATEVIVSLF